MRIYVLNRGLRDSNPIRTFSNDVYEIFSCLDIETKEKKETKYITIFPQVLSFNVLSVKYYHLNMLCDVMAVTINRQDTVYLQVVV